MISNKRRRSTGNITPKELATGNSSNQLLEALVQKTRINISPSTSHDDQDESDITVNNYNNDNISSSVTTDFGVAFFDDLEAGEEEDWKEELRFFAETLSFDATIDDQITQAVEYVASEDDILFGNLTA